MPELPRRLVLSAAIGLVAAGPAETPLPDVWRIARTGRGAPARWRVEAGGALAQVADDPTDYRFPLAIHQSLVAADVAVALRFRTISGKLDQAAGIAVRLTDPDNYYVVRANALEDNVNFYRVVKGSRQEIKGVSAKVASGAWHALGLRAKGDRFTIDYDGKTLFSVADRVFAAAGRVALWTKADSVTWFDEIDIRRIEG